MKTPEEWAPEMLERFRAAYSSLEVDLEETMALFAKEIQLDAQTGEREKGIVEGLEIAANLAKPLDCYPDCQSPYCDGRNFAMRAILLELTKRRKELEDKP